MLIDLEAACRAVCLWCRMGHSALERETGRWVHGKPGESTRPCEADPLRKLAAREGITSSGATVGAIMTALSEVEEERKP